jgi:hypothetical protein
MRVPGRFCRFAYAPLYVPLRSLREVVRHAGFAATTGDAPWPRRPMAPPCNPFVIGMSPFCDRRVHRPASFCNRFVHLTGGWSQDKSETKKPCNPLSNCMAFFNLQGYGISRRPNDLSTLKNDCWIFIANNVYPFLSHNCQMKNWIILIDLKRIIIQPRQEFRILDQEK